MLTEGQLNITQGVSSNTLLCLRPITYKILWYIQFIVTIMFSRLWIARVISSIQLIISGSIVMFGNSPIHTTTTSWNLLHPKSWFSWPDKWAIVCWHEGRKGGTRHNERGKDKLDQQFQDYVIGIIVIRPRLKFNQYGNTFSLPLFFAVE